MNNDKMLPNAFAGEVDIGTNQIVGEGIMQKDKFDEDRDSMNDSEDFDR